jgi:hypothetical protein
MSPTSRSAKYQSPVNTPLRGTAHLTGLMPLLMRHLAACTYGTAETAPIDRVTIKTIESGVSAE